MSNVSGRISAVAALAAALVNGGNAPLAPPESLPEWKRKQRAAEHAATHGKLRYDSSKGGPARRLRPKLKGKALRRADKKARRLARERAVAELRAQYNAQFEATPKVAGPMEIPQPGDPT